MFSFFPFKLINRAEKRPPPETVSAGKHRVVYSPPPPAQQNRRVNAHPSRHREAGVNDAAQTSSELSGSIDLDDKDNRDKGQSVLRTCV